MTQPYTMTRAAYAVADPACALPTDEWDALSQHAQHRLDRAFYYREHGVLLCRATGVLDCQGNRVNMKSDTFGLIPAFLLDQDADGLARMVAANQVQLILGPEQKILVGCMGSTLRVRHGNQEYHHTLEGR